MTEIKVSQLPEASEINDADLLMIVQSGTNKKITKANARFASGDEISIGTTQPVEDEKLWINPEDIPSGTGFELDKFYPVGSIYINTTGTNPSTFMGGTWQSFGAGRVLVGQDTTDTDFDTLLETGGSKYLQEHIHNLNDNSVVAYYSGLGTTGSGGTTLGRPADAGDIPTKSAGTGNSGNLQPYIVVSMWVRTA